jgi:cell division protein FtsW
MMISRARRNLFSEWWWTVDRLLIAAVIGIALIGIVLLLKLDPFYFIHRHAAFLAPALAVLIATSLMSPRQVRRVALVVFLIALALTAATLVIGPEIKGARRWIGFLGMSIQPSEFLKPAFVVLSAWLFAESGRRPEMPTTPLAIGLLALVITLLVQQPDFGQTVLIVLVWSALFFLAGLSWIWVVGFGSAAAAGIFVAYRFVPHVAARIDRFLDRGAGDTFQIDTALESFARGGWFGQGPGEGTVKRILPDSHTDFIFAVAAEEFGIVLCLVLVALFAFVVLRALAHALSDEDRFTRLATAGLAILFGVQSGIAMAVNLHLMPAKGMTLPFISYGGSSLISLAYGMGMLIALTRRRPRAEAIAELEHQAARGGLPA